ncbi:MAG: indolepyruvate ferredoxin oxidoreductase subunit alpha, partial [Syntrophales bacterium]
DVKELAADVGQEAVRGLEQVSEHTKSLFLARLNPRTVARVRKVLKEELARSGASVIISQRACVLFKRDLKDIRSKLTVDIDKCVGCKVCIGLGCPAISWIRFEDMPSQTVKKNAKKQEGVAFIDRELCTGCTLCEQVCNVGAVSEVT